MTQLEKLLRKRRKLVIGLMSGTSIDGVDTVLLRVQGSGTSTRFKQLAFTTTPYPKGFRNVLLKNSNPKTARLDNVVRLNMLVGEFFAQAAAKVARIAGQSMREIDLIGSHGQTIAHHPERQTLFGRAVGGTLQIGDPSLIAKRTGVVTVGDFRVADVAVGGSGAPLVPYVDYLLFRSRKKNRALLNIGGVANITVLPRGSGLRDVIGFDTGPGNMVIDAVAGRLFKKSFDRDGALARGGRIIPSLLRLLTRHPYLRRKPPKSTGREMFGETFVESILSEVGRNPRADVAATVSAFTAIAVYDAYVRFVRPHVRLDELFVSGGGAHNWFIMEWLKRLFGGVRVETAEAIGMSSDAKEAICFALLANETVAENPANVPGATGAKRMTVLGKICLP